MSESKESFRARDWRIHAFGYARRIVLSLLEGELDAEGLYFDLAGLRKHLAESDGRAGTDAAGGGSRVRMLSYNGPLEVVAIRFCREVEALCRPVDIPDPILPHELTEWAAAAQRNIRSRFAGWSREILDEELDAVAEQLAKGDGD